jgi:hypothetical protein
MSTRRSHVFPLLVLLAAGLGFVALLAWREADPAARRPAPASRMRRHDRGSAAAAAAMSAPAGTAPADDVAVVAPAVDRPPAPVPATRAEAASMLRTLYRREQFTRELALEQQRYGAHYWSAEHAGAELGALQRAKAELARELSAEAEAVLRDLFPGETGEGIALSPIFDADHPGPQVACLTEAARARLEAAFVEQAAAVDTGTLLELAQRVLTPEELELYRRWNDPAAAALRQRLAGFAATEAEFQALLADARLAPEETPAERATRLAAELGPRRAAQLAEWEEPALRTAAADLQRRGLSLENARWLAATRAQAQAAIQNTWADARLDLAAREQRVAQIGHTYAQAIAAQLALPAAALDELFSPP